MSGVQHVDLITHVAYNDNPMMHEHYIHNVIRHRPVISRIE